MPGGENEVVPTDPARLVGIIFQRVTVEHRAHLGTSERQSEVPGF